MTAANSVEPLRRYRGSETCTGTSGCRGQIAAASMTASAKAIDQARHHVRRASGHIQPIIASPMLLDVAAER